jgi:hypothetical protein
MRIVRTTALRSVFARKLHCAMFALAALLAAQEILNNEAIIKMVKAGVPDEVIVEMIRTRPGHYSLSPDNVIELKKQGVPAAALTAMVKKDSTAAAPATAATPPAAAAPSTAAPSQARPAAPSGSWQIEEGQDQMSGDARVYAARIYPTVDGTGVFNVEAVCQPKVFLNVGMSYQSNRNVVLKATSIERKSSAGLGSEPATTHVSCVLMRLRVGGGLVKDVTSDSCDSENFASILFRGDMADMMKTERSQKVKAAEMGELGAMFGPGLSGAFGQLLNAASNTMGPMSDRLESSFGVGKMADVLTARSVKIELPLSDGSFPFLEIAPQEPSFQLFASKCGQPILDPRRGYLGASFRTVTPDLARQSRLSVDRGVIVSELLPATPAARSGLRTGDVITAVDAKPVDNADLFSLAILSHPPGATVNLDVLRDNMSIKIAVTLDRRPAVTPSAPASRPAARTGLAALGAANPMKATSRIGAPAAPPLFTGTAETFATAFPGFVERAASQGGIEARDFDKEIVLILNTVKSLRPDHAANGGERRSRPDR